MKGKKLMAMLMAGSLLLAGLTGCGGATAKGGGAAASADDYPNGPVTIICPWGVGGGADVISRKISEVAKNYFDQPIIVENHTGRFRHHRHDGCPGCGCGRLYYGRHQRSVIFVDSEVHRCIL